MVFPKGIIKFCIQNLKRKGEEATKGKGKGQNKGKDGSKGKGKGKGKDKGQGKVASKGKGKGKYKGKAKGGNKGKAMMMGSCPGTSRKSQSRGIISTGLAPTLLSGTKGGGGSPPPFVLSGRETHPPTPHPLTFPQRR